MLFPVATLEPLEHVPKTTEKGVLALSGISLLTTETELLLEE